MTTPTSGDLSARLLADELDQCAKFCEVYSPDQCATLIDGIGWIAMRHKLQRAAETIRALSALPAAVGTDFAPRFTESQARGWKAVCATLDEIDPDWILEGHKAGKTGVQRACDAIRRLATTSQPSADRLRDALRCVLDIGARRLLLPSEVLHWEALLAESDAAVGAQGDDPGEFGMGIMPNPKARYWQERADFWRGQAIAHGYNPESAAPAAGKGVDDANEREAFEKWARPRWSHHPEAFANVPGRPEPEYNHNGVQAAWAGWQAALTRQPVAGDGQHHKLDTDRQVFFYEQDFYVLSNFSAFTLEWKGHRFDTSEAAYHWEKFPDAPEVQDMLLEAPSAHAAFKLAESQKVFRRPDWDDVKLNIMRDILRAKATQHEYVRRKLLATGTRELVEDSWRDDYWGWGPNRDGRNWLGRLWMEVRAELAAPAATPADGGEGKS